MDIPNTLKHCVSSVTAKNTDSSKAHYDGTFPSMLMHHYGHTSHSTLKLPVSPNKE
jgi:hypothetical protein